jgi:hypothetical protein
VGQAAGPGVGATLDKYKWGSHGMLLNSLCYLIARFETLHME